jgi:hypothetical protein
MSVDQPVSSPTSTGGSGTFFEQHVGAQFLSLLLVRGIPPLLKNCQVEEVHFQNEERGWSTDDVLIIGDAGQSRRRKLAAQVKRSFTVSSNDEACRDTFSDFWSDFHNPDIFDPESDRLALITLRGTNTLLDKFASLLDCARASTDGEDFQRRLSIEGLISKKARQQADHIRTILDETSEGSPSDDEFWQFLCVLNVISFDLNTQTAQHESWIKTLLAQTATEPDQVEAAKSTWNELLQLVGGAEGMPAAGSYEYEDLPEELRVRHEALGPQPGGLLRDLIDHTEVTLDDIQTSIAGSVEVPRDSTEAKILDSLRETQVTVVNGAAGHGKSAIAKNVIEQVKKEYFCVAFRAEEFAKSHIDQTLTEIDNSLNSKRLLSILSAQGQKAVLVDGVERLLESSERKAFTDLLRLSKDDRSLKLILTCRDYSVDTVKMSLLEQVPVPYEVLDVSPFTDDELNQVAQSLPRLVDPLEKSDLKELLRSPYFLNIAARIDWAEGESLPDSEREFRDRCWSEVIRSEVDSMDGMPRKRENVFLKLSQRRAQKLRPYVPCENLDSDALEALRKDDLVSFSERSTVLAAPAHDVLEDWAIIHWLDERYAIHERDPESLANDIGGYPALRRGYRKWLGEMLELDSEQTDRFVLSVFKNKDLPAYFRDDTIISALLSSSAKDFLVRNRNDLLDENGSLLARVIHLLRVACKTAPSWLDGAKGLTSQLLVPTGSAWAPILEIVSAELEALLPQHFGVVLGLVEDWSQQVTYWDAEPSGYEAAGEIIVRLLNDLGGYGANDQRDRALEVLAKVPGAVPESFKDLLERAGEDNPDNVASDFADLLLTESSSSYACEYFPEEITDLAISYFCLTEQDAEDALENRRYRSSHETGPRFGIKPGIEHKFSVPASALRGPFYPLLQRHPNIGVGFIIDLLNHACSWYGEQKWPFDSREGIENTLLKLPDENKTVYQWADSQLYQMYRGTTTAPCVLESALMAFEKWLLEIAEIEEVDLESWLSGLLGESNNVAITGVVASVCIAYPCKCGSVGLALLSSPEVIQLDRSRMAQDQMNSNPLGYLPTFQAKNEIYQKEREQSNNLPHRRKDLEALARDLQLGKLQEHVFEIIDEHKSELPPKEEQSYRDRKWRLALNRMDLRNYEPGETVPASEIDDDVADSEEEEEKYYTELVPTELDSDLQEIVERNAESFEQQTDQLSLMNWGRSAWERNLDESSESWREMLSLAKEQDSDSSQEDPGANEFSMFTKGGTGFVAAACVRDHWEDMSPDDRSWCVGKLIDAVKQFDGSDDLATTEGRGSMFPDRYSANALSCVLRNEGIEEVGDEVLEAIATALTHSTREVRQYAAEGIGQHLVETGDNFPLRCAGALAAQVRLVNEVRKSQGSKPPAEQLRAHDLLRSVVPEVRKMIITGDLDAETELENLSEMKWFSEPGGKLILRILGYQSKSELAATLHSQVLDSIVSEWQRDREDRFTSNRRDYQFENWCAGRIAMFALKLEGDEAIEIYQPLIQVVEDHPEEVSDFVKQLIIQEDGLERETPFWKIWQAFANCFSEVEWVDDLDAEYVMGSQGRKLLRALLFGIQWKEDTRYWPRLNDQEYRVEEFVQGIPASTAVLEGYCRFLYNIGEKSLPGSFTVVAERLKAGDPPEALAESNTVYFLESLLRRYVYGEPLRLKTDPDVRKAVLYILDQLVEAGSSAAYQMRDDFVTPARQTATA